MAVDVVIKLAPVQKAREPLKNLPKGAKDYVARLLGVSWGWDGKAASCSVEPRQHLKMHEAGART